MPTELAQEHGCVHPLELSLGMRPLREGGNHMRVGTIQHSPQLYAAGVYTTQCRSLTTNRLPFCRWIKWGECRARSHNGGSCAGR